MEDIIKFYKEDKRYMFLIALFFILLFTILFINMSFKPYAPILVFTDDFSVPVNGAVMVGEDYVGETVNAKFSKLSDDFCKGEQTVTLSNSEGSYSWRLEARHVCATNVINLKTSKS